MTKILLLFLSLIATITCGPLLKENAPEEPVFRSMIGNFVNCANNDLGLCLKEHALKATERISSARKLDIFDGLTLYNHNPRDSRSLDTLSSDVNERRKQVNEKLWDSTANLLQNSELEFSYGPDEEESRSIGDEEEGRGKKKKIKKKLKLLFPLALILKAKALLFIALALGVVAFSLFKITILAKLALIWKIVEKLKGVIGQKSSSVEVWASPHYTSEHDEHSSLGATGWGSGPYARSASNDMAYNGYKIE